MMQHPKVTTLQSAPDQSSQVAADFDPEDVDLYRSGDESSNADNERDDAGTEHYEAVE
jgi:hypothetical protein